ncbi:lactadherin-like [Orbicella faveolata]|uniref:lactadherin-like n=1 Tax=Orbicella faveolata TaxID=48498 RepID=UPI0009E63DF6|nr:lactadherin-like [Orbicella faveolata]
MENGAISDEQITASSQYTADHAPHQGRLHFLESAAKSGSWVAATGDANQWLQIDLRTLGTKVTRVATQGSNGVNHIEWVTNYMLQYCGNDGVTFRYYREQGETADKIFTGNTDQDTVVSHDLNPPIRASFIRFVPVAWHSWISMRVELYGCQGSIAFQI